MEERQVQLYGMVERSLANYADIANKVNVSYSYDINNSNYMLSEFNKGTHEIILGFLLNNIYGDLCPKNIW